MGKKRFALAGASSRGYLSYGKALSTADTIESSNNTFDYGQQSAHAKAISEAAELVGVFDKNPGRVGYVAGKLGVEAYTDFDEMLKAAKPDCVIVATTDYSHAEYIIRSLDAGCEVFCEKPMCINAEQCRAILEAEKRNNRKIGICFNMRYFNSILSIKQLINSGVLGDIYNVHFEWLLTKDYSANHNGHGASYFRRWNAYMEKCGGLLLTKSTHHFDMINWFINGRPKRVSAFGKLRHYGKNGTFRGERCSNCCHASECPYYTKITPFMQEMYVNNEPYDGYMIDRCVFDEAIDSYDTMALNVEYDNGVLMSYSESAAAMYEGFKLFINGSDARLEVQYFSGDKEGLRDGEKPDFMRLIKTGDAQITTFDLPPKLSGGHYGADDAFQKVLFLGADPEFDFQRAGATDGAYSVLIGAAANESIRTGQIIDIDELIGDPSLLNR